MVMFTIEEVKKINSMYNQSLWVPEPNKKKMTSHELHIYEESLKHNLDYLDLYYAAKTIEHKYKGNWVTEQLYASLVANSTEHLWHEAYFCAIFGKKERAEIWPHHNPMNPNDPKNLHR